MSDQRSATWVCPWGLCNHDQAQACRATTHRAKGRAVGCGGMFPVDTTPEQAKQMVSPPAGVQGTSPSASDEAQP